MIYMNKRITFSLPDACHLYELALDRFQDNCYQCESVKKRLEQFIGSGNVDFIKELLIKHPYEKPNTGKL